MFSRVLSFCTVPIETGMPVLLVIACPVTVKVMISIVFPAAGSAGSQRDAGGGAVAGAVFCLSCVAAIALAGVIVGFVVADGASGLAPVVAENAVLGAALYAGFARGAGGRFVAAGMESTVIVENELLYVAACLAFGFRPMGHRVWRR